MTNVAYFRANDSSFGQDLWETDGTGSGTFAIGGAKNAGVSGTYFGLDPQDLTAFGFDLLFQGRDAGVGIVNGYGLWVSNGTAGGTYEVGGIYDAGVAGAGSTGLDPSGFLTFGNKALFFGFDKNDFEGLWVTNGTAAGTTEIGGLDNAGISGKYFGGWKPADFTAVGNEIFFVAKDTDNYTGLWVTNGTAAGTTEIGGLNNAGISGTAPAIDGSFNVQNPIAFDGKLLFDAADSTGYYGIWVSDGTATGTTEIANLDEMNLEGTNFAVYGNEVLFQAVDSNHKTTLWITDGTSAGTTEIGGINNAGITGAGYYGGTYPSDFEALGNEMFFVAVDSSDTTGIWITNGTAAGTTEIGGLGNAGVSGKNLLGLAPEITASIGNKVLFTGWDPSGQWGLWVTDGTAVGTFEIGGTNNAGVSGANAAGLDPSSFVVSGQAAYFLADNAGGNSVLWISNGTVAGTYQVSTGAGALYPADPIAVPSAPTLTVQNAASATRGQMINLSSLVTISDPDDVGYQDLELYDTDGTLIGGQFVISTVAQPGKQTLTVSPADVTNASVVFDAGTWGGTDTLYARLLQDNGTLTAWEKFTVTVPSPTLSVSSDPAATRGQPISLATLVSIADPGDVGYQTLELYDTDGTLIGGQFVISTVAQTGKQILYVSPTNFTKTVFDVGTLGGTDTLYARLLQDNGTLTAWQKFTVTAPVATLPVLTVHNDASATAGQAIELSSLLTIADPDDVGYQMVELYDTNGTVAGGQFAINSVAQPGKQIIDVSPANVTNTVFDAGTSGSADTLYARLLQDNGTLTAWQEFRVSDPVTVTGHDFSIESYSSVALASAITVSNPSADSITEYAFWDAGGGSGGSITVNGTAEADGQWIDVSAGNLGKVDYVGGAATGTQTLEVEVYDATTKTWTADSPFIATTTSSPVDSLEDPGIRAEVAKLMVNNSLSYQAMLTILDDAATGGMTSSKFSTLQTLYGELNVTGGISTSTYVQDITQYLIEGNGANATLGIGNLSAISTPKQVDELIGNWFLGTDLPSTNLSGIGGTNYDPEYEADTAPLFGASGKPSYLDVNQGAVGDCYFLAALGEVALQDPTAIEAMITTNGNGTYGVRFFVDGVAQYETVDDDLPYMTDGDQWASGSTLEFANGASGTPMWAELVEKAFAQLNADPNAAHGATLNSAVNSYEGIDAGDPDAALAEITGQTSIDYAPGQLVRNASVIGSAFGSGKEVEVITPDATDGNLIGDHVFEVIGYGAGTFTLHNPWGSAASSPAMTFTETASALAADSCSIDVAQGTANAGASPSPIAAGAILAVETADCGNLSFVGSTGTLQLDDSQGFFGTVAGLSGQDTLDLRDINFATVKTPTYLGNSAGGTLTVTDGAHSANIALLGNYLASSFVASSDGHGGTNIVDPQLIAAVQQAVMTQPQHA
jgi:ELWxxDGT repeat protein